MSDLNLTELRRVAEGVLTHSPRRAGKTTRAERFCLAASPATVLALIDRLEAAEAKVERVRTALANHPRCERHPDDDPITCGWKSAVLDVQAALKGDS